MLQESRLSGNLPSVGLTSVRFIDCNFRRKENELGRRLLSLSWLLGGQGRQRGEGGAAGLRQQGGGAGLQDQPRHQVQRREAVSRAFVVICLEQSLAMRKVQSDSLWVTASEVIASTHYYFPA